MKLSVHQRIFWQILFWIGIWFLLPIAVTGGDLPFEFIPRSVTIVIGIVLIITLNLKILFPHFYAKGKVRQYILFNLLMIILLGSSSILLRSFFAAYIPPIPDLSESAIKLFHVIGSVIPFLLILLVATVFEIAIFANRSTNEAMQLKAEKLETELKFLKSQINPHFLFNSLNNIYTLTVLEPALAGKSILKLSEMLRYLLYECDAEKVPLSRELTYLQNYIALFELKDEEALNIKFDAEDVDGQVMIAPLLFIPFIENSLKHSQIEDLNNGWIYISLFGDTEKVYLEVTNSIPLMSFSKDDVGGIGLQNVKRQLELLYPNRHELKIEQKEEEFGVYLTVYL